MAYELQGSDAGSPASVYRKPVARRPYGEIRKTKPHQAGYVARMTEAADSAVAQRFLLLRDASRIIQQATAP